MDEETIHIMECGVPHKLRSRWNERLDLQLGGNHCDALRHGSLISQNSIKVRWTTHAYHGNHLSEPINILNDRRVM